MENKKYLIVLVLKILESQTDFRHPLTQTKIAELISAVHSCDRKTVGRNIKFLRDIGYPILKTGKGFYFDKRVFSIDELNYIFNAIRNAPQCDGINKDKLLEKTMLNLSILIKRK